MYLSARRTTAVLSVKSNASSHKGAITVFPFSSAYPQSPAFSIGCSSLRFSGAAGEKLFQVFDVRGSGAEASGRVGSSGVGRFGENAQGLFEHRPVASEDFLCVERQILPSLGHKRGCGGYQMQVCAEQHHRVVVYVLVVHVGGAQRMLVGRSAYFGVESNPDSGTYAAS